MCGKGSNTTTSSQTPAAYPQLAGALTQSQNVAANNPFQAYGGQYVAPINAQQNTGIGNINQSHNLQCHTSMQALQLQTNAAQPLSAGQIQNYLNPYTQNVVNTTQAAQNTANQQALQNIKGNAIAQGALGGDRESIAEGAYYGAVAPGQAQQIANLYNQGYNTAVQTAEQQYQVNPQSSAFGLTSSAIGGQNAGLTGANAQVGAGTLQQGTQQAQDTAALNRSSCNRPSRISNRDG